MIKTVKHLLYCILLIFFVLFPSQSHAIENPLAVPNNKFGVHILFNNEIRDVVKLINSNNGDWGYVLIPIQAGDKNIEKWQKFMDEAKKLHIIPIIRLASEGNYFNTKVWRKPTSADILDFANFLSSLEWPTKNRYIIVFNEVNRSDEWGGETSPTEYADLLSYAVAVFKNRSEDFFIISAGLDNASATIAGMSYNQYEFMRRMDNSIPDIFYQIDGIASHSYPNPAFSQPPNVQNNRSIASFRFERELIQSLSGKTLPIFITETGWSRQFVSDLQAASYYKQAFETVWNDPNIVTVIPFLLDARSGPFVQFSLLNNDGSPTKQYEMIESLPKTKGEPVLNKQKTLEVLGNDAMSEDEIDTKSFKKKPNLPINISDIQIPNSIKIFLKWIMKL